MNLQITFSYPGFKQYSSNLSFPLQKFISISMTVKKQNCPPLIFHNRRFPLIFTIATLGFESVFCDVIIGIAISWLVSWDRLFFGLLLFFERLLQFGLKCPVFPLLMHSECPPSACFRQNIYGTGR